MSKGLRRLRDLKEGKHAVVMRLFYRVKTSGRDRQPESLRAEPLPSSAKLHRTRPTVFSLDRRARSFVVYNGRNFPLVSPASHAATARTGLSRSGTLLAASNSCRFVIVKCMEERP